MNARVLRFTAWQTASRLLLPFPPYDFNPTIIRVAQYDMRSLSVALHQNGACVRGAGRVADVQLASIEWSRGATLLQEADFLDLRGSRAKASAR